jgi:hypothetical protein
MTTFQYKVKSAQTGEGGEGTPTPFHYTAGTITYKVVMHATAERADTLPLFLLYPYMYSVIAISIQDLGLRQRKGKQRWKKKRNEISILKG